MLSDRIFHYLGDFGRYQQKLFFWQCLPVLACGIQIMLTVYTLYLPPHRCAIPGLNNDTYKVQNEAHAELINKTIPYVWKNNELEYAPCEMFSTNDSFLSLQLNDTNRTKVACHKWVYDKTTVIKTAATEMNMVCSKEIYGSLTKMWFMVGMLVGSFMLGIVSDKFGRKPAYFICLLGNIASTVCVYWIPEVISLEAARFTTGVFIVGLYMIIFVISVEHVGSSKRTLVGVILNIIYTLGEILTGAIAYFVRDWRTLCLLLSSVLWPTIFYWCVLVESPRWLILKKRYAEAETIFRKAAYVNKVELPEDLFLPDEDNKEERIMVHEGFLKLFKSKILLLRSLIIFFNWSVISFVFFGLLMISNNLAGNLYVNTTVNAAVEIPAVIGVLFVLDRWGRKPLYFSSVVLAGLACLASGLISIYLPDNLQWISVTAAMIGKFGASAGFTIIYIFTTELFPTVVRNAGVGASSCAARIGSIVAPYTVDLGHLISSGPLGTGFPMLLYGVLSLIAGGLSLYLPETLGKDLPETITDGERFGNSSYTFLANEEDADNNDETDDEANRGINAFSLYQLNSSEIVCKEVQRSQF